MFCQTLQTFFRGLPVCNIFKRNAGHSKWANIKHIKAVKDGQRSLLFTRLSRQMKIAAHEGGSNNPSHNIKLTQIIEQAKRASMPAGSIQNVLKSLEAKKDDCKPGFVDVRGPGGLIILCEVYTSNFNRCKMNIAIAIKKSSMTFADGNGRNSFYQKGVIETNITKPDQKEDEILELATEHAIEAGAEDVKLISDDTLQFTCESSSLKSVQTCLENFKYTITSASVEYLPNLCVNLRDDDLEKYSVIFDKLENCEDVVKVYDNIA